MGEPRTIKPEDIEGYVAGEYYFTAHEAVQGSLVYNQNGNWDQGKVEGEKLDTVPVSHQDALAVMTFCVVVLKNGFTLTGESACADPAKFNAEIGRKIARANALNKAWPLMGYVLRSQLAGVSGLLEPEGYKDRARRELAELEIRITKLRAYLAGEIPTEQREDLEGQLDGMVVYCSFLERRVRQFEAKKKRGQKAPFHIFRI